MDCDNPKKMLFGGFNPSEKYEGQLGSSFPTEWKVINWYSQYMEK